MEVFLSRGVSVLGGLCLEGLCLCLPSLKSLESVVLHTYTESLFVYAESIWCSDQSIIRLTDFKISGEKPQLFVDHMFRNLIQ